MNNSETAILILHEYLGSNKTMKYLNNNLTQKGFFIECPNILGHGTNYTDLENIKYTDWINQIEEIYSNLKKTYKKIFIVGFSFGGLLALHLVQKYSNQISGIILINNLLFPELSLAITPFFKNFIRFVPNLKLDIKDKKIDDILLYKTISVKNSAEVVKLANIVKKNIKNCTIPTLIIKSNEDHRVNTKNATKTYDLISTSQKKLIYLDNSYHIAVLDFDKDIIIHEIINFIKDNL